MDKTVLEFLGAHIIYDAEGQDLFAVQENGHLQPIADIRGWGAIQNLFMLKGGAIDMDKASKFQDNLGQFMADAINEKMQRESQTK